MKATILVDVVPTKARQAVMSQRCTSTDLKKVKMVLHPVTVRS